MAYAPEYYSSGSSGAAVFTQNNTTHYSFIGETHAVSIPTDDYTAKTLRVVWELPATSEDDADIAVVEDASITKTTSSISFSIPSAVAASNRKLVYSIRDTANGNQVLSYGYWIIQNAALKDS